MLVYMAKRIQQLKDICCNNISKKQRVDLSDQARSIRKCMGEWCDERNDYTCTDPSEETDLEVEGALLTTL